MSMRQLKILDKQPGVELDLELTKLFEWESYVLGGIVRARRNFEDPSGFDFQPSTSWSGMDILTQELRKKGIYVSIHALESEFLCGITIPESRIDVNGSYYEWSAKSAPEAVAKCAIVAHFGESESKGETA